jgi:hypothetical protein
VQVRLTSVILLCSYSCVFKVVLTQGDAPRALSQH